MDAPSIEKERNAHRMIILRHFCVVFFRIIYVSFRARLVLFARHAPGCLFNAIVNYEAPINIVANQYVTRDEKKLPGVVVFHVFHQLDAKIARERFRSTIRTQEPHRSTIIQSCGVLFPLQTSHVRVSSSHTNVRHVSAWIF